ncbi:rhamnulokinase [Actinomyces sp.]
MMTTVVAIDLGASSGRVLRGVFDGERLAIEECSRFPNGPVALPGPARAGGAGAGGSGSGESRAGQSGGAGADGSERSRDEVGVAYEWDILALWRGILDGLREASLRGPVDAIGIDTWAVDYGLLDEGGRLIGNPASYRSARCGLGASEVLDRWDSSWLYARNGLQFQPFNTLFQRVADRAEARADCARTALLIPDLLAYWLTGQARSELTNASTTGLVNAAGRDWDPEILGRLRDDFGVEHIFPPLISPGEVIGEARVEGLDLRTSTGERTPVVAVGSHDTASAVAGVPARTGSFAYISSGTWSLVGTELSAPVLSDEARAANFTNELGVDGTVRFLANIMGMWVQQECLREWAALGDEASGASGRVDWPLLDAQTEAAQPARYLLDMSSPELMAPGGMVERVRSLWIPGPGASSADDPFSVDGSSSSDEAGAGSGDQQASGVDPTERATVLRAITDSLALAYRRAIRRTSELSGTRPEAIHLVGGGSKNRLLAQETADATGIPVIAGPVEATALGNMLISLRAIGAASGTLMDLRAISRASSALLTYEPRASHALLWDEADARLGSGDALS